MVDLHLSLLVAVLDAELDILGEGLGFLLCKAGHNRDQHFSLGIHQGLL